MYATGERLIQIALKQISIYYFINLKFQLKIINIVLLLF